MCFTILIFITKSIKLDQLKFISTSIFSKFAPPFLLLTILEEHAEWRGSFTLYLPQ